MTDFFEPMQIDSNLHAHDVHVEVNDEDMRFPNGFEDFTLASSHDFFSSGKAIYVPLGVHDR